MNNHTREKLTVIILCLIVISVFLGESSVDQNLTWKTLAWPHARAILSISMIIFFIFTLLSNRPKNLLVNFKSRKELIVLSLIPLFLFVGFLNSESFSYIFQRIQIKIPFLVLAFCAATVTITRKNFCTVLYVFLLTTFSICIYTFFNYLRYFDQINASYLESKVMPSPINHVRFSILIAVATYVSYYLLKKDFSLFKYDRILLIFAGIFLFIFVHIFSVRSGIIALYGIAFTEILIFIFIKKEYKKGIITLICILFPGALILNFSPTLRNKLINTKQDISVYQSKLSANYNSLATRMVSYEIAIDLFKENIFLGCGLGNFEIKNTKLFKEKHPEIVTPIIPHNQFLYYLASMGIVGFVSFLFSFFFPLFYHRNYKNEFLLMVYIALFLSFMTEAMIENQLGVACTVVFIILPLMIKKEERFQ